MDTGDLLSILGTLITGLIALHIFNQWKSQKGSEVLAIEAKEIFSLIEQIPPKKNEVFEDMMKMSIHNNVPNDFDKERFIGFRAINVDIIKRSELIKFKNKHKDTLKFIEIFNESYREFASYYHQSNPINLDELLKSEQKYKMSYEELKKDMYEYSLYKKTI